MRCETTRFLLIIVIWLALSGLVALGWWVRMEVNPLAGMFIVVAAAIVSAALAINLTVKE